MRNLCLILGLIFLPAALRAGDVMPIIKREAGKCAAAWQRSDYAGILAFLPPTVIKRSGGRATVLRRIQSGFARARRFGVDQLEIMPGPPAAPRLMGRWYVSVIPATVVVHQTHLDLTQATHVLGVSSDQGAHWFFVPLYQATQAEVNAWFPEFAGKVLVPDDPMPEVEVVF